jgi:hypothetical protein
MLEDLRQAGADDDLDGRPHDADGFCRYVDERVEQWNRWYDVLIASDLKNYINGNFQFSFEYLEKRGDVCSDVPNVLSCVPRHIDGGTPHRYIYQTYGEIGDLLAKDARVNSLVVCHWGQTAVFIRDVNCIDPGQKAVASGS